VARHRLEARAKRSSHRTGNHQRLAAREVVARRVGEPVGPAPAKVDQSGKNYKQLPTGDTGEVLDRAPADVRATIQQYWADGLDVHSIVERLSGHGVTVQNVLVERYLHTG
jgi:hypothetical protein